MAEEKLDGREVSWRRLLPWTLLFRTFEITFDLNKLLLAAGGILTTALVWWFLAVVFSTGLDRKPPEWTTGKYESWGQFSRDRKEWNLMNEAAGLVPGSEPAAKYEVEDVAATEKEYELFKELNNKPEPVKLFRDRLKELEGKGGLTRSENRGYEDRATLYRVIGQDKPAGRLTVSPWSEDRGPNPYLLVTGQTGIPWEPGHFGEWFFRDQLPVMVEPLTKMVRPVILFLSPGNTFRTRLYFITVTLLTIMIWSFFGGAITRIAAVQIARNEKIGAVEAIGFTLKRFGSYLAAPLIPLGFVLLLFLILLVLGFLGSLVTYIPFVGDLLAGGLWVIPLLFGLIMAMALVGLVGWPLMAATISTEGTDYWEAFTRAYASVFTRPWHYIGYSLLGLVYGGLVIFFIGFMGSMTAYLAKWAVSSGTIRDPNYLFVYAPTSFGWRELLLEGATVTADPALAENNKLVKEKNGASVVASRATRPETLGGGVGGFSRWSRIDPGAYDAYLQTMGASQTFGAALVSFWLGLGFILMLSFGYVFFWVACTINYLLLRKSQEAAELDEVYMEEEDYETNFPKPAPVPAPAPAAPTRASALPVVEAPRAATAPAPVAAPAPAPAPPPAPTPPQAAAPASPVAGETPPPLPPDEK